MACTFAEKREEKLQSAVVVTDMSEEERKKMEEERKQMEEEREEMKRDRERMEKVGLKTTGLKEL